MPRRSKLDLVQELAITAPAARRRPDAPAPDDVGGSGPDDAGRSAAAGAAADSLPPATPPSGAGLGAWPADARLLIALVLAALTLAAYGPVVRYGFVNYDDPGYVYENDHVRRGLTGDGLPWAFTSVEQANWHPLTWLSHMLDVEVYGVGGTAGLGLWGGWMPGHRGRFRAATI